MELIPHESECASEDVAKGFQDYLICTEMFVGAIIHSFDISHIRL